MIKEIEKFSDILQKSNKILLINHIRMDWDAWGSLGWFALILKEMGKNIACTNDCPVPPGLQFLWHNDLIQPGLDIENFAPDIIISLDASDTGRLWESYIRWKNTFDNTPLIVIDHHVSNPHFWDINIIDPDASSVCEIMTLLIEQLSLEKYVTKTAATFIYTGLQTDSNMYFNTNTRPSTLRAGAKLMELGADFRLPVAELYKKRTKNQLDVWAYALKNIKYSIDGKICWCSLTREWLRNLWIDKWELGGYFKWLISEIFVNVEWVQVAYLIYPLDKEENKISMRSQEWLDVAKICEIYGWGWHKQAAWFQTILENTEIEKKLITDIEKIL